jgi:hypothetical protein
VANQAEKEFKMNINANTYENGDTLPYFPFYYEWMHILEDIPDEEYGRLIKAIFRYAEGEDVTDDIPEKHIHTFKILASIIRRAEYNRKNNRKGARTPLGNKSKSPTKPKSESKIRNSSDTQRQLALDSGADVSTPQEFVPPTRDEVRSHFKSRGFRSDPDEFINFHTSVGWRRGNQAITDWRAASESWELCYKKKKPEGSSEKPRYGNFDAKAAFDRAVERTLREAMEGDE